VPQDHSNLPAVHHSNGVDAYRASTDAAGVCGAIVKATAIKIQGRKYVQIEGWQAIAIAHGCIVSARDVEKIDGGLRAIGEVRRMSDGALLATAEGFLGDDEPTWAKRPMYARRAFVQTRAMSRACRSAFAHVVVMIDKDLGTTPAEEVPEGGFIDGPGSSWGPRGKEGAIDDAEADGLMANAPKEKGSDKARREANLAKCIKKVDDAIATMNLSGQTVATLDGFWNENETAFTWINDRVPTEFERLEKAYMSARDAAEARAS
jgi:hypothetical protein